MPYIPSQDRPVLDAKIDEVATEIVSALIKHGQDVEVSYRYKIAFGMVFEGLYCLEMYGSVPESQGEYPASRLAEAIFEVAKKYRYKGAWLGGLNYSLTRLIQVVPRKMVEAGVWKEELRYWLYAQTVGALERAALDFEKTHNNYFLWIVDGVFGVAVDVKDEYKRRVNTAYEAVQIKKNGDCYDTPYRTEVVEVKDPDTLGVVGYLEVMRDERKKP